MGYRPIVEMLFTSLGPLIAVITSTILTVVHLRSSRTLRSQFFTKRWGLTKRWYDQKCQRLHCRTFLEIASAEKIVKIVFLAWTMWTRSPNQMCKNLMNVQKYFFRSFIHFSGRLFKNDILLRIHFTVLFPDSDSTVHGESNDTLVASNRPKLMEIFQPEHWQLSTKFCSVLVLWTFRILTKSHLAWQNIHFLISLSYVILFFKHILLDWLQDTSWEPFLKVRPPWK